MRRNYNDTIALLLITYLETDLRKSRYDVKTLNNNTKLYAKLDAIAVVDTLGED